MIRYASILCLLSACGAPTYYSVDTYARGIEQPAVGQNLLAAAPITDDYTVRLTGGVSTVVADGAQADGPSLYTPRQSLGGGLAIRAKSVEFEFVGGGALSAATGGNAPREGASFGGLRLRGSPGGDTLRVGIAVEGGLRGYGVQHGTSVICEVEPVGEGWVRTDDGCWASEAFARDAETKLTGYFSATLYPTVQVVEGVYVFGGVGLSSAAVNHTRRTVYKDYEFGPTFRVEEEDEVDWQAVVSAVGGVEAQFGEFASLLFNVRTVPFGQVELDTVAEAGVSMRF